MKTDFKPGTNVFAKVGGKIIGPIYFVQIDGDKATLQGANEIIVPLADLCDDPSIKSAKP